MALGEIDAGPGITGQAGCAFNEWHSEGKDLLTKISRLDRVLFQKEGKGWESAWRDDEVLVEWVRQTTDIDG